MKKTTTKNESRIIEATPAQPEPTRNELTTRALQVKGWPLTQSDEEREPRISALELAKKLGFSKVYNIRKTITRMINAGQRGEVVCMVPTTTERGGRDQGPNIKGHRPE